jgi:hypothetical protein
MEVHRVRLRTVSLPQILGARSVPHSLDSKSECDYIRLHDETAAQVVVACAKAAQGVVRRGG